MKFLRILFSRFDLYFRRNRLNFCLMILSGVLTAVLMLYFYGNLLPIVFNRTSDELYYRTYTAQVDVVGLREEELAKLSGSGLLSDVELRTAASNVYLFDQKDGTGVMSSMYLSTALSGSPDVMLSSGEKEFSSSDAKEVILTDSLASTYFVSPGDTFGILGESYTVIGVTTMDYTYLPYNTFLKLVTCEDYQDHLALGNGIAEESGLTAISAVRYNAYQEDEVLALLRELFPEAQIETPYVYRLYDETSSYDQAIYMCILYAISMVSFLMLFLRLVESTADVTAVYRIVGATGDTVATLHFWEVLTFSFGSSLLGVLLHALLYKPLFSKMNLVKELSYRFSDYCLVLFSMVVITLLLSLPFVWRATRLSPIAARRAAE